MTPLIKAFINESFNTPRYAILLAIVFGKEFEELRERNLRGEYSFEHISHEGYWERGVNKLELPVAIFFSYKFSVEVHPEVTSILRRLEIELQNNSESDPLDFIDKEINPLH